MAENGIAVQTSSRRPNVNTDIGPIRSCPEQRLAVITVLTPTTLWTSESAEISHAEILTHITDYWRGQEKEYNGPFHHFC